MILPALMSWHFWKSSYLMWKGNRIWGIWRLKFKNGWRSCAKRFAP
jgi:hypothetical protein